MEVSGRSWATRAPSALQPREEWIHPRAAADAKRPIVIFPEGTRTAPGAKRAYHPGVAALYGKLGLPVVPVALNSGLFWPRRGFVKRPGRIVLEFLPPIAPGGTRKQVWHYPSRAECMTCHSRAAQFVLGLTAIQMNREHDYDGVKANQLRTLAHIGLFNLMPGEDGVAKLPKAKRKKLPHLSSDQWCDLAMEIEESSPLEARAAYHHALWSHALRHERVLRRVACQESHHSAILWYQQ